MVDYSKWDNLDISSDEDEEYRKPAVYKVDNSGNEGKTVKIEKGQVYVDDNTPGKPESSSRPPEDTTRIRSEWEANATRNGGRTAKYLWSQTKDEVSAWIFLPPGARAKDLQVSITEETCKVVVAKPSQAVVVEGRFKHRVELEKEEEGEEAGPQGPGLADWEVQDIPHNPQHRRAVVLVLKKAPLGPAGTAFGPGEGVVVWWDALLQGDPTIDTKSIEGRKGVQKFSEAWAEAQEMFRQKVKNQQPIIIPHESDSGDADTED